MEIDFGGSALVPVAAAAGADEGGTGTSHGSSRPAAKRGRPKARPAATGGATFWLLIASDRLRNGSPPVTTGGLHLAVGSLQLLGACLGFWRLDNAAGDLDTEDPDFTKQVGWRQTKCSLTTRSMS